MSDLRERAKRGAEFLDAKEPGWAKQIKLRELDLGDQAFCVLGQLHGDYDEGLDAVGLEVPEDCENDDEFNALYEQRYEFGFDVPTVGAGGVDFYTQKYDELTRAWKDEIRARRAKP